MVASPAPPTYSLISGAASVFMPVFMSVRMPVFTSVPTSVGSVHASGLRDADLLKLDRRLCSVAVGPREEEGGDAAAELAVACVSLGRVAAADRTAARLAEDDARA